MCRVIWLLLIVICMTAAANPVVQQGVSVSGPLSAKQVQLQTATTKGITQLKHFDVKSNVTITSALVASHGTFLGDLIILSNHAVLSNVTLQGALTMRARDNAVIELRCHTRMMGNIRFEGAPGIVKKSNDVILRGSVINGQIQPYVGSQQCE